MKKVFLIFSMAGCLSLINGINNAGAVQSEDVVVTYTCPAGCELRFVHGGSFTMAECRTPEGKICDDPSVNIEADNAISPATPVVNPTALKPNKTDKVNAKKSKKVSARSAETPRMVKKIVYEPVSVEPGSITKVSSGFVNIECPEGCEPKISTNGNKVMVYCLDGNGNLCNEKSVKSTNIPGAVK